MVATALLAGGLQAGGIVAGLASRGAMSKANRAARRIAQINAFQTRLQAVRAEQQQRAQVVAAAGNEGSLGSSGVQGTLGSITSTTSAQFSYANQVDKQNSIIAKAQKKAQKLGDVAGLLGGASSLVQSFGQTNAGKTLEAKVEAGVKAAPAILGAGALYAQSFFLAPAVGKVESFNQPATTFYKQ